MAENLVHTDHGVLCRLCHVLLHEDTAGSIENHCNDKHGLSLASGTAKAVVDAAVSVLAFSDMATLKSSLALPCIVQGCLQLFPFKGEVELVPDKVRGALLKHVKDDHNNGAGHVALDEMKAAVLDQGAITVFYRGAKGNLGHRVVPKVQLNFGDRVEAGSGASAQMPLSGAEGSDADALGLEELRPAPLRTTLPAAADGWRRGGAEAAVIAGLQLQVIPEHLMLSPGVREGALKAGSVYRRMGGGGGGGGPFHAAVVGDIPLIQMWEHAHGKCAGGADRADLVAAAEEFMRSAMSQAESLHAASPRLTHLWQAPAAGLGALHGADRALLSQLEEASVNKYSNVLGDLLRYINHAYREAGQPLPFPAEDSWRTSGEAAAARIYSVLRYLEYGTGGGGGVGGMGWMAQYLLASTLVATTTTTTTARGGLGGGDGATPARASDLALAKGRAVGDSAKALLWGLRGVVTIDTVLAARQAGLGGRQAGMGGGAGLTAVSVEMAGSAHTLFAAIHANKMIADRAGAEEAVQVDMEVSKSRGSPTVRIVTQDGTRFLSWDSVRAGATLGMGVVKGYIERLLALIGVDDASLVQAFADPFQGRHQVRFRPHHHIADVMIAGVGEHAGEQVYTAAMAFVARSTEPDLARASGIISALQNALIWRMEVVSGCLLRGTDLRALRSTRLGQGAGGNPAQGVFASGDYELSVTNDVHKTAWLGEQSAFNVLDYGTAVWVAVFVLLKEAIVTRSTTTALKDGPMWTEPLVRSETYVHDVFSHLCVELMGVPLSIGVWRQAASRLVMCVEGDLEAIVSSVMKEGGISGGGGARGGDGGGGIARLIAQQAGKY